MAGADSDGALIMPSVTIAIACLPPADRAELSVGGLACYH